MSWMNAVCSLLTLDIGIVLRKTDLARLPHVELALKKLRDTSVVFPAMSRDRLGREVLTASAPIGTLGWLVFVDLPVSEALQPVYAALERTAFVLAGGLLFAALAGVWLARRMVVPIRALATGAARIGGGDLDHRIEVSSGDEVQTLADSFNEMGARLKDSYATLEHKVADRTRELSEALDQLRALIGVSQAINSTFELQALLEAILSHACRLADAGGGAIYTFDDSTEEFTLAATHGMSAELIETIRGAHRRLRDDNPMGQSALRRTAIEIADVATVSGYELRDALLKADVRALLAVPLLHEGRRRRSYGAASAAGCFRAEVVKLLKTFAAQAVIAIQNARMFPETEEARAARRRQPGQVAVPGQHEPRDPHADERRHRHERAAARHAARRRAARLRRHHPRQRRRAADHHQRHPRLLEDRSRAHGHRGAALRPARLRGVGARPGQRPRDREAPGHRLPVRGRRARRHPRRRDAAAADPPQPAGQCGEVHRTGRGGAHGDRIARGSRRGRAELRRARHRHRAVDRGHGAGCSSRSRRPIRRPRASTAAPAWGSPSASSWPS